MAFLSRLMFLLLLVPARGMDPLALMATQGHWQAAEPIVVNVDYDGGSGLLCVLAGVAHICAQCNAVPAFGTTDEIEDLRKASAVEYAVAKRCWLFVLWLLGAWRLIFQFDALVPGRSCWQKVSVCHSAAFGGPS
jgi:hypothetical protein